MKKEKPSKNDLTGKEVFWFSWYLLTQFHKKFLRFITKFEPFSHFWRYKLYHHRFENSAKAIEIIKLSASISRGRFDTHGFDENEDFIYIYGKYNRKNDKKFVDSLNKSFDGNFYIREEKGVMKISTIRAAFLKNEFRNIFPWV